MERSEILTNANCQTDNKIRFEPLVNVPPNTFINADCMHYLTKCPDNYFDLAIVDPPYGVNIVGEFKKTIESKSSMFNMSNGIVGGEWDASPPPPEYFIELFRVSKNQIIWGGNYFINNLSPTRCFLIWDKMNGTNPMADAELAWTSFSTSVRMFRMHHFSEGYDKKIHPTQKPTKLYKWILKQFAKAGDLILDTHVGSASSLVACKELGFDYVGFEKDKDYFEQATKRLERAFRKYELEFE